MDVSPGGSLVVNQNTPAAYPATYTFAADSEVQLEAKPTPGSHFESWSGDLNSTASTKTIVMDCDKNIKANFAGGSFHIRWPDINWSLVGWIASPLVLAGLLITVLIVRRGT
ncbi:hypothetical protein ACFLYX_00980 [Chloroflexota bacterium]